eukprot:COSAG05_NODE_106_length_18750_cov_677.083105_16_plen_71_part_00
MQAISKPPSVVPESAHAWQFNVIAQDECITLIDTFITGSLIVRCEFCTFAAHKSTGELLLLNLLLLLLLS